MGAKQIQSGASEAPVFPTDGRADPRIKASENGIRASLSYRDHFDCGFSGLKGRDNKAQGETLGCLSQGRPSPERA